MEKVRGDDELFEILSSMGGSHRDSDKTDKNVPDERSRRSLGEDQKCLGGTDGPICVPEAGWNRSIWNPHVGDSSISGGIIPKGALHLPQGSVSVAEAKGSAPWPSGAGQSATWTRPVFPQEEVLRQQAVAVVFSRFQFSRKLKEGPGGDPILPAAAFFDPGLEAELRELGVTKSQAKKACSELGRASKSALKTLSKQLRAGAGYSKKRVLAKKTDESTYVLQLGKNRLRLNSAHYDKMKELFRRTRGEGRPRSGGGTGVLTSEPPASDRNAAWTGEFHDCLFACLMRYEALQGGGFQASMGGDAFDVLLRRFGVRMECFASPFNCRYARYCSAFADTDSPFGSLGSFFEFRPTEGAFEANPPFVRDVILKMALHMEDLLKASSEALTFVVIIPSWEDAPGWVRLRESKFQTRHLRLDQKDHVYCEGKQHLRRNRHRLASFHTSVFFLQTAEAARLSPVSQEACDELARAFAPKEEAGGDDENSEHGGNRAEKASVKATTTTGEGALRRRASLAVDEPPTKAEQTASSLSAAVAGDAVDVRHEQTDTLPEDGGAYVGRKGKRRRHGVGGGRGEDRSMKGRTSWGLGKDGVRRRRSSAGGGDMVAVGNGDKFRGIREGSEARSNPHGKTKSKAQRATLGRDGGGETIVG